MPPPGDEGHGAFGVGRLLGRQGWCNDDAELATLIERFADGLPEHVTAMNRALAGQDVDQVALLAHQLAGAAGSYGFPAIGTAAQELERIANIRGEVEEALAALADLCRRVRRPLTPSRRVWGRRGAVIAGERPVSGICLPRQH